MGGGIPSAASAAVTVHVDSVAPGPIGDLAVAKGTAQGELDLSWTAPGDDGGVGTATSYEVRWATVTLTHETWGLGTVVSAGVPTPQAAGAAETMTLEGLTAGQLYHVGIRTRDELGNVSLTSNIVSENAKDTTEPQLTFTAPADGSHHRATADITATTTDNVGVVSVVLEVDGAEVATDTVKPWSIPWDTTAYADGDHTVKLTAADADANATSVTRLLVADNTAPTIAVDLSTTPTASDVTLAYTIGDNLTAEADLVVTDDGGANPPYVYTTEGSYEVTLTVTDKAGNSAQDTVSFLVDKTGPEAVVDLVASSFAGDATQIDLAWTAPDDSLTDVVSYEVRWATELFSLEGNGSDGSLVVTGELELDVARTTLTGLVAADATTLFVADESAFAIGDEVLLAAAQCDVGALTQVGRTTWGEAPKRIIGLGAGQLLIDIAVGAAFDGDACTVLVQKVPNYTTVTVHDGGRLTAPAWDGSVGGILALRAETSVQVLAGGEIEMTGRGLRGSGYTCLKNDHGLQGEGYARVTPARINAALFNGGGGGTGSKAGTPGHDCAGGGGGGHGAKGTKGGDYNGRPGGPGGDVVGDPQLTGVFLGGAGGQGGADEDGGTPGGGGHGGGVILIASPNLVSQGAIRSNGYSGQNGCNGCGCGGGGCGMGGGGGGAGGTIHLSATTLDIANGATTASGGGAGSNNGCGAGGGPGAVGRVRIDAVAPVGLSTPVAYGGSIQSFDWASATPITQGVPTPAEAGSVEAFTAGGFEAAQTYYFALRSTNDVGLVSINSNVAVRDAEPPSIAITAPLDGATLTRPVVVTTDVSDDVGAAKVEFKVDGQLVFTDTASPFSFGWAPGVDGAFVLTATVTDAGGQSASDQVSVTFAHEGPGAPKITAPIHEDVLAYTLAGVAGTAEAGTTVALTVNGVELPDPVIAAPAQAVGLEAELKQNKLIGCELTAGGDGVEISDVGFDGAVDLARASVGATSNGSSRPSHGIDGIADDKDNYWYRTAAQNETLFYLGRVTLGELAVIDTLHLHLWDGDARSYYNYKIAVSADGTQFTTWVDQTGSGEDYQGLQVLTGPAQPVQIIDVWLSGNTTNDGAHIKELKAFRSEDASMCVVQSTLLPTSGAALMTAFEALGTVGDGSVTHQVQNADRVFEDVFEAGASDATWLSQNVVAADGGGVVITGTNGWGTGYLASKRVFDRSVTDRVETRVTTNGGASMWGLKRPGTDYNYTTLAYAIYLNNGAVQVYEDGSNRGQKATITYGVATDFRIEPTPSGAIYSMKAATASTWTTLYNSGYFGGNGWQLAVSHSAGSMTYAHQRVRGAAWYPVKDIATLAPYAGTLRFRSVLSRPGSGSASPTVDRWQVSFSDLAPGVAGPGLFSFDDVALVEGNNTLFAQASDAFGTSPVSPTVNVIVDTGPPDAIADLAATSLAAGVILLTWSAPANEVPSSYVVYRSANEISSVDGLVPLKAGVTATSFGDLPPSAGLWHYTVVSVDAVGNVSAVSNDASGISDAETPHASISIAPLSPVGAGSVTATVTASKDLAETPTLTVLLPGQADPAVVTLTPVAQTPLSVFAGTFDITAGTPSGVATFAWAGIDPVGNTGTAIDAGASFQIDTAGPIATVIFDPPSPLTVGDIQVSVTLNEPATGPPSLALVPAGGGALAITLTGADVSWTGTLTITETTGEGLATLAYSATDALGNVGTTIESGGTVEIDAVPPDPPTGLAAVKHPAGYFDFTWQAPAGEGLSYTLYRSDQPGMTVETATPVTTGLVDTATQSQPPTEGTWYYAVSAVDASGKESALSNIVSVLADPPPPEDVTDLTLVVATDTTLELTWTASANTSGLLAGYRVYLDGAMVESLPPDATGYTYPGLTPATAYALKVSTFDSNNKESIGVPGTGWTLMDNPTGLVALGKDERIELTWTAPAETSALLHYAIYMADAPFADVAGLEPVLANPGGTTATINGLTNGETKYVAVTSVNKSGFQNTAAVAKSATPGDNEGPEAPAEITVTAVTKTTLAIEWTASADLAGDLAGYRIERDGVEVGTVASDVTSYTLEGLTAAQAYTISVIGADAIPNDGPAAQVVGYTLMPHPAGLVLTPHDASISLSFDPPAPLANVDAFRVYLLPADFSNVAGLTAKLTLTSNKKTASLGGLTNGTTYFVAVTTVNKSGAEDPLVVATSTAPVDDAPPPPVKNLKVVSVGEDTLGLTFTGSVDPGDLAGYRLYQDGVLVQTLGAAETAATVVSLAPSSQYLLRVDAFDTKGNQGLGPQIAGYTLMDHPANVAVVEPAHKTLVVGFDPPTPLANVKHFAVYLAGGDFSDVTAMTPAKLVSASSTEATLTGLTNGQTYFVAVTTVNKSLGERTLVTTTSGAPVEDVVGPALSAVTYAGAPLADGGLVEVDGSFGVTASDPVGMSHVLFRVDGNDLGLDQAGGDGFTAAFFIDDFEDGLHTLTILGYDSLGNETQLEQSFTVKLAPPAPPVLTAPVSGSATNNDKLLVKGTAKAGTTATIYVNSEVVGTQTVDGAGGFSFLTVLTQLGTNTIEASATNTGGEGEKSAPVSIIYDNTVPTPPKNLTATAKEGGVVRLVWFNQGDNPLSGVAENRVYRHNAPFDDVSVATLLNGGKLTPQLFWSDLPPDDGVWYYRATVLNNAGTESLPSNMATATADSTPPKATEVVYTPLGAFVDGVFGVGPVGVTITFSEPLLTTPFFSLATDGGLPLTTSLTKLNDTTYTGQLIITANTQSGTAFGVLSARDKVNNKGTQIEVGGSIEVDTDAPDVLSLEVLPAPPIKNDPSAPATVTVSLTLSEPLPASETPQLSSQLTISHPDMVELALAKTSETTWTGGFILPEDAGAQVEVLAFTYLGLDELGNESTTIVGPSSFEVYQGELPALKPPLGLTGKALPSGEIQLTWFEVAGAAHYQIWRKAPGDAELTVLTTEITTTFIEKPGADGAYQYGVASVRQHDGQESVSGLSNLVIVTSDSAAPGPPQNLTAQLVGNGILLSFDPPSPLNEVVTFSIYRSPADEITSLDGLAPLVTGLPVLQAVDPTPSTTEHAYVVAAVDGAGNVSAPSNSVYLNPGLLPVASLKVEHLEGADPVLSWTHANPVGIAGYQLTVNDLDPVGSAVVGTQYVDVGFAGQPRAYAVTAVDDFDFESVPRTLLLPIVTAAPTPDELLRRGIIDTVDFHVTATTEVTGAQLLVKVGGVTHPSAKVTLAAGITQVVPVVIGGYASLDDVTSAEITVLQVPNAGEEVRILSSSTLNVVDDTYSVDLLNDKFTRGGTGAVQLVFHNTSDQTIELVTALASGSKPSNEITFQLTDSDGNVLSTAPLHQGTGEGVINLPSGVVVARVEPGESFTSSKTALNVPLSAPDDVIVKLATKKVHFKVGKPEHVEVPGPSATLNVALIDAPYTAKVTAATPELSYGEAIVLTGHALDAENPGAKVAEVKVTIVIAVGGFERTFDVFTDAVGDFTLTFKPLATEGGIYTAWANHPHVKDKSVDASFTVSRVNVTPPFAKLTMATSYPAVIPVKATAMPGTTLTNLRIETVGVLPTGLTVVGPPPQSLSGGKTASLPTMISGDNNAPGAGQIQLKVVSDEHTWATIPVDYTLAAGAPALAVSPPGLETGVARGNSVTEVMTLTNKGTVKYSDLTVKLVDQNKLGAAPSWVFLASSKSLGDLALGDAADVTVAFAPSQTVALSLTSPYTFYLRVEAGGEIVTHVPIYVWVNDSGVGGHLFKVTDIYTATLDADGQPIEGVAGASVQVDKLFGTKLKKTIKTDNVGEALFENLPTGTYKYRVTKGGKKAGGGNIVIKPGVTGATEVFLSTELVTIEWEVTETTIQDKYEIVLSATFETDVPAAVVLAEPSSVALPDMDQGHVFYGEYTLTNYGLITAENVNATLPTNTTDFKFELLVTPPGELLAKEQVTIPYRVTRLTPPAGSDGGGGGCLGFSFPVQHCYGYKCVNGTWAKDCTAMWYTYVTGICTGGSYDPGYVGGGGFGGYSGPGGGQPVPGSPGCDPCEHPELSSAEKECCKANKEQESGSAVDLIGGAYSDEATDLAVAVLGHDVTFDRYFEANQWRFRFFGANLSFAKTGAVLSTITLLDVAYAKVDEAGTVFADGLNDKKITSQPDGGWLWTNRTGDWRAFDADGLLSGFGDRNDRKVLLVRDDQGVLTGLEDTFGTPFATYTYAAGKVAQIDTADGRTVKYEWSGEQLVKAVDVLGQATVYTYDAQGRMTSKVFANGKERHISWASNGVIGSVLDEQGHGMYFDYGYNSTTQQSG